jgi:hypothetical protein
MSGSASGGRTATRNGTRCAIRPEMKCTSRDRRSSLATITGPRSRFACSSARASFGRRSSASAPLPVSISISKRPARIRCSLQKPQLPAATLQARDPSSLGDASRRGNTRPQACETRQAQLYPLSCYPAFAENGRVANVRRNDPTCISTSAEAGFISTADVDVFRGDHNG